jgi:integrase
MHKLMAELWYRSGLRIKECCRLHEDDLALGFGRAWLPPASRRKYPNAERELGWQYLFPSSCLSADLRERQERIRRRHQAHVDSPSKAVRAARDEQAGAGGQEPGGFVGIDSVTRAPQIEIAVPSIDQFVDRVLDDASCSGGF